MGEVLIIGLKRPKTQFPVINCRVNGILHHKKTSAVASSEKILQHLMVVVKLEPWRDTSYDLGQKED